MAWFRYESPRERKARMELELRKRVARGEVLEPLGRPVGRRHIAQTFWGRAWCEHIESYSDYEYRLPRGRSYLRQGNVYNLSVEQGRIRAQVTGSTLYDVEITIEPLSGREWTGIQEACAGQVGSLLDLLGGRLGTGVMEVIADKQRGLFPGPRGIRFNCSCPDYAGLCKHSCAVLYGVALRFDADPALFFKLRGVDPADLLSAGADQALTPGSEGALEGEDLSALFGIDFGAAPEVSPPVSIPTPAEAEPSKKRKAGPGTVRAKSAAKKTPVKTPVKKTGAARSGLKKTRVAGSEAKAPAQAKTAEGKTPRKRA